MKMHRYDLVENGLKDIAEWNKVVAQAHVLLEQGRTMNPLRDTLPTGKAPTMKDTYFFPFPCMTSPRPRFGRGHVFMPKEYQAWKASVRALLMPGAEQYKRCRVHLYLYEAHEGKDGDNLLKSVLDAIQGVLIPNDNLKCVRAAGFTYEPTEEGGFSIVIESVAA